MTSLWNTFGDVSYWLLVLYEWVLIAGILLSWFEPNPNHPLVQGIRKLCLPLWVFVERLLPWNYRIFGVYLSLALVWFAQVFLPGFFRSLGSFLEGSGVWLFLQNLLGYDLLATGIVLGNVSMFFVFLGVLWFVLNWIGSSPQNPFFQAIYLFLQPCLKPLRKLLPPARIDYAPLVVAGVALLLRLFLATPLSRFGASLLLV